MRRGKLWGRVVSAAGLGLSVFLSSFGNVSGAYAAEPEDEVILLETVEETEEDTVDDAVEADVDSEDEAEEAILQDFGADEDTDDVELLEEYEVEPATAAVAEQGTYAVAPRDKREADNSLITRDSVHDGAILHAFCWSFNTIAENMADIADAGYTAVQTSPINECLATDPGMNLHGPDGMWWYHYQPTDWVIGNYQLGSRDEFKHMCDVADEYGIAVIVDILPNHTTPTYSQIADALYEAAGGSDALYHTTGKTAGGYTDRLELTYYEMGGLPDVDTENAGFQQYFYEFLKDCVYLGADGFRIDTAKHIALPDDPVPSDYASDPGRNNFYPNMRAAIDEYSAEVGTKSYDELFVYGEVLQGTNDRLAAYQQYIGGTTASNYGASIRSALTSTNLSVNRILDYQIYDDTAYGSTYKADAERLVTWVESHDTYMNDGDSCWKSIYDRDVILGWSIIGARKAGTPLFFSRPNNSSPESPYGDNLIGEAGSDIYKAPEVKAVNKFRREMGDVNEYLSNPGGNNKVLMIERKGDAVEGAVIVNAGSEKTAVNCKTQLTDGIYRDQVEGSSAIFLVKDGVISGTVAARGVVVLTDRVDGTGKVVSFYNADNWSQVKARVDGGEALDTEDEGDGWFSVTVLAEEFGIRFENEDGTLVSPEYVITEDSGTFATPRSSELFYSKKEAEESLGIHSYSVYFFNTEGWSAVNAYGWLDGGEQIFGGWPGEPAVNEGEGWWRADIKSDKVLDAFNVIFNNGNGVQTVDITNISAGGKEIFFAVDAENSGSQLSVLRFTDKESAEKALGVSGEYTTAYFYDTEGWGEVSCYIWGAASFGDWPGQAVSKDEDGWYKVVVPAGACDDLNIIFNNGGNGKQTPDMKLSDMKYRFFMHDGITYRKFGSKKEAMEAISGQEEVTYKTVYFYNEKADDSAWQDVFLYVYGGNNGEYNHLVGQWPGKKMVREEGSNWYSAEVPEKPLNTGTLTYIFNNGNGTQLGDNRNITAEKCYFTMSSTDSFESKETVYEFLGYNPEEPEVPEIPEPVGKFVTKWGTVSYVQEDGTKVTGFARIDGYIYYFKANGSMVRSDYVTVDDKIYYLDASGHRVTGFYTKWGKTYYYDANGVQVRDSLIEVDGDTYYINVRGGRVTSSFVDFEDGRRFFDSQGKMVRGRTITRWCKKYTFDDNGILIG
ncbi:starch-binding protein [Butyrivibrio sp. AE3009]|uniref:starch-binding protein n=1 Tax=Butyrivibrio sp. AE3009 TaxID=1280666 RepID=UPI0003B4F781|nr:starch-binding protein [Butyrivibrio sp. AE3009]